MSHESETARALIIRALMNGDVKESDGAVWPYDRNEAEHIADAVLPILTDDVNVAVEKVYSDCVCHIEPGCPPELKIKCELCCEVELRVNAAVEVARLERSEEHTSE